MYKRKSLAALIRFHILASAAAIAPMCIQNAYAQDEVAADEVEEVVITGVRNSLKESASLKKNAAQIMDAISAEDIGQLPDNNMAEALQRVTGIQIGRDDSGAGSGFQVRGLSENRVEIDGQSMAGSGESRSNSFGSIDSALFSGVEVYKSPMADMTEGAIGATIRLKTKQPLAYKKTTFNINAQAKEHVLVDDLAHKVSALGATKFDLDKLGEFGVALNLSNETQVSQAHSFSSNWGLANPDQIQGSSIFTNADGLKNNIYRPQNLNLEQKGFDEEKIGYNLNLQWAFSDRAEVSFSANQTSRERFTTTNQMGINTSKAILARDVTDSNVKDEPVILGPFTRPAAENSFLRICNKDENFDGRVDAACHEPATGEADRFVLQNGVVASQGSEQSGERNTLKS